MGVQFHFDFCTYTLLGTGTITHDYVTRDYETSVNDWDKLWIVDTILRCGSLTDNAAKRFHIAARDIGVDKQ